jgi:hypothetical protein
MFVYRQSVLQKQAKYCMSVSWQSLQCQVCIQYSTNSLSLFKTEACRRTTMYVCVRAECTVQQKQVDVKAEFTVESSFNVCLKVECTES